MESIFYFCVIGQDEVVVVVVKVVRCVRVGLKDFKCLIGLFIFLGFIGVGKIELVWVFVEFIFGDEEVMIRIDMFEYMEKYLILRFVGLFLGYVGYDEGG